MKYFVITGNDQCEGLANIGPFDAVEEARAELKGLAYGLAEDFGVDVLSNNFVYEPDWFKVSVGEWSYSGFVHAEEVKGVN